jgi:peptidoglycan/LPS O-acetylase OafA/YrhL
MAITITALYLISSESQLFVRPVLSGLSCFFGGALVYLVYRKIAHVRIKKIQGSIIEAFTIIAIVGVVQSEIVHRSIVTTILFYLTILVFSFQSGVISELLRLRPFQVLGKLSYSIYMIHAAILFCITSILMILQKYTGIEFAPMIDQSRFLKLGSEGLNNALLVSILVFVIFTSNLTYKYIELKWQRIGKSKTFPSSRK